MTAATPPGSEPTPEEQGLQQEIARLNKIVRALMDRAERSAAEGASEFGLFQTTLVLEELVQRRTEQLREVLAQTKKIGRRLTESEARFRALAEQSLAGIAILETNSFTYVNSRFAETFGYTRKEIMAIRPLDAVTQASRRLVNGHVRKCLAGEEHAALLDFQGQKKDGTIVDIELASSRMRLHDKPALIFVVADVTARKQAEHQISALNRRLAQQAIHDPLTGMYNRRYMEEALERELLRAKRNDTPVSVVMCDLDHFKDINDTYGHQAGDKVLKTFGSLVKRRCRATDIGCRYGGEEFLLVFPNMPSNIAYEWAEHMRVTLAETPISEGKNNLVVTASFGVAVYPTNGVTRHQLVSAADSAQYAAKAAGRNRVVCAPSQSVAA
jgi:diguanylate cyclase (GGDEF)-like protein/PAS domain S-box-containing protein